MKNVAYTQYKTMSFWITLSQSYCIHSKWCNTRGKQMYIQCYQLDLARIFLLKLQSWYSNWHVGSANVYERKRFSLTLFKCITIECGETFQFHLCFESRRNYATLPSYEYVWKKRWIEFQNGYREGCTSSKKRRKSL
jgi:hypothetical protein